MELIAGNKQTFLNFINSIGKEDGVAVITHTDLDGVASAILIDKILKSKGVEIKKLFFINLKQSGMFDEALKETEPKINKIFVTDINISSDFAGFEKLKQKAEVFVVDHHPYNVAPSPYIIKTRTEDCTAFTIYNLAEKAFDLERFRWLVCSTMVSEMSYIDESNLRFIQGIYLGVTFENINNSDPGEIAKIIASSLIYFKGKEKKIFDLVSKNELGKLEKYYEVIEDEVIKYIDKFRKEEKFYPEKNIHIFYDNPKFSITSIVTTLLSMEKPDDTFIFVSDIEDSPGFLKVSSRNQGGKVDLNLLMRQGVSGLENSNAGGHFRASGAVLMKKDFQKFKENLLR